MNELVTTQGANHQAAGGGDSVDWATDVARPQRDTIRRHALMAARSQRVTSDPDALSFRKTDQSRKR